MKPITHSGMKPNTESGQADHQSERSDAGAVQLDLATLSPDSTIAAMALGLVKVRARTVWKADGRHILHWHRVIPVRWPESPNEEREESAYTHGSSTFADGDRLLVGLPCLVVGHHKHLAFPVESNFRELVRWLKLACQTPA